MIVLSPWHHKAKALCVAASCGWSTRAVRHSPSFISALSKVCSKSTRTRFLAVISLRCFLPKARWAAVLTSWTVEEGRSVRISVCPLGKVTFMWIIWDILEIWTALQNISNESLLYTWSPSQARIHDLGYPGTMQPSFDSPHGWWIRDRYLCGYWKLQADCHYTTRQSLSIWAYSTPCKDIMMCIMRNTANPANFT